MKKGYLNQKYLYFTQLFVGILDTLSPLNINWFAEISGIRGYHLHLKESGQF